MKGSGKTLISIAALTGLFLVYVHFQIAAVLVSFDIHKASKLYVEKQEILERFKYKVEQLKAPRLLEAKMKQHDLGLSLPNKIQVVEVPPVPEFVIPLAQEPEPAAGISTAVTNFLGRWIQTAQAKTDLTS